MKRFENKVCVITGSTDGIGLGCAKRFLLEGGKVVISSRKEKNVLKTVDDLRKQFGDGNVSGVVCHINEAEARTALWAHVRGLHGGMDVFVSNAAVSPPQPPILKTSEELWDKIFDVNVKAAFLLAKEAEPLMNQGGAIVFVSSAGAYSPGAPHPAYGVSKTALHGLTKALASEYARKGVRVNAIAPGMIKTSFSKPIWSNPDAEAAVAGFTMLKRLGEIEEIAGSIAFLASFDANYITGEILVASGGGASRL